MKANVFSRKDFLNLKNITEDFLIFWERTNLLKPMGYSAGNEPLYSSKALAAVNQILKLKELGYNNEDIKKIIKKVGLPSSSAESQEEKPDMYLTVGVLAEKIGVSPRTIKHWEDKGIIEPDMHSEGGFRLYQKNYIFLGKLIRDLQLFGYTLDEIKTIADYFRAFIEIQNNMDSMPFNSVAEKISGMEKEIPLLFNRISQLKEGISRWEDLLKKKKREISALKSKNEKRKNYTETEKNI